MVKMKQNRYKRYDSRRGVRTSIDRSDIPKNNGGSKKLSPPPPPPHQYGIKGLQTTFFILMGNRFGQSLNTRYSVGSALPSFRAGPDLDLTFFCRLGLNQTSFFQVEPSLDFIHPEDHPVFVKICRSGFRPE